MSEKKNFIRFNIQVTPTRGEVEVTVTLASLLDYLRLSCLRRSPGMKVCSWAGSFEFYLYVWARNEAEPKKASASL